MTFFQRSEKSIRRIVAVGLVGGMLSSMGMPMAAWGANPPQAQPEKRLDVTVMNIALFYASMLGVLMGAASSWMLWLSAVEKTPEANTSKKPPSQEPKTKPENPQ